MSQVDRSFVGPRFRSPVAQYDESALCSLVYRSRALASLSDYELYELVQEAQAKNAAHAITGLLLYDEGRFYQWLEGPRASIGRLMQSITADRRHVDIEILHDKPCEARKFGDWKMRLATRGIRSIHSVNNVVVPSVMALGEIRQHPEQAAGVLAGFSSEAENEDVTATRGSNLPLKGPAGLILKDILVTAVLPDLFVKHANQDRKAVWPIDHRARALADLLIGPDTEAAIDLLRSLQGSDIAIRHLYEKLLEPAARRLGDLWGAELCTELDVTLGLSQLHRAIRVLNEEIVKPTLPKGLFVPAVLIVPEPGEAHSLNSVLDADVLTHAGWDPLTEFPVSDEALQDLIAGTWFDALDLSLSPAFRREHWLPRVTQTIALARHASRNPALVVVVGGRIFAEDSGASTKVGADGSSATALSTERLIREKLSKLHSD